MVYRTSEDVVNSFYNHLHVSMFLVVRTREGAEGLAFLDSFLYSTRQFLSCLLNALVRIAFLFKTIKKSCRIGGILKQQVFKKNSVCCSRVCLCAIVKVCLDL